MVSSLKDNTITMGKNDDRIIELQKLIAERESAIPKVKFDPVTSCILELDGVKYNLNVADINTLIFLYCKLESLNTAYNNIEQRNSSIPILKISGFELGEWICDVSCKINDLLRKAEKEKLKNYKNQLEKLLSEDKKTELMLDEIMAEFK